MSTLFAFTLGRYRYTCLRFKRLPNNKGHRPRGNRNRVDAVDLRMEELGYSRRLVGRLSGYDKGQLYSIYGGAPGRECEEEVARAIGKRWDEVFSDEALAPYTEARVQRKVGVA